MATSVFFNMYVAAFIMFAVWTWTQDTSSTTDTNKLHQCNLCGKVYLIYRSLWRHKRYECGKPAMFQCPFCQYRAKQKIHLVKHIANLHGNC